MRTIEQSTQFRKDYRKAAKSIDLVELDKRLDLVIACLLADQPLPERFKDHALKANWRGHRDCHLFPDLVLIYPLAGRLSASIGSFGIPKRPLALM